MILYWVTNYSLSALWIATGVFFTLLALTLDPSGLGDLNWSTSTKNPNERADHKKARKQMQIVAALQKRRDKLDDLLR